MEEILQKKLVEFVKLKYPSRSKSGVRYVDFEKGFAEVMFEGGETLFFSETFLNELRENT